MASLLLKNAVSIIAGVAQDSYDHICCLPVVSGAANVLAKECLAEYGIS
ncbi:MAG: hypothetical protein K2O18_17140 [Oscillospiraceae bacterium]|nr:hypothetical protein [Oscillospiraceae bacterium]